jgi:hypothetical protein
MHHITKKLSLNEYTKNQQLCQTQIEVIHNQGITNTQALPIDFKECFQKYICFSACMCVQIFEKN